MTTANMAENVVKHKMSITRHIMRSWFELTLNEQIAILIVLSLLLLGLIARYLLQK